MAGFIITLAFLLTFIPESHGLDGLPPMDARRAPGMQGDGPFEVQSNVKFEYDSDSKIFKDEAEAKEYQALFDKNKESKEIKDYFAQLELKKKEKMDEMRKKEIRPDFSKMKEERAADLVVMIKELKLLLEKKKVTAISLNKDNVKCEAGKTPDVLEKANIDSLKDSSKVVRVVLTEEEFARMKQSIKDEVRKEMMNYMAKNKPKEDERSGPREKREGPPEERKGEERKMAGNGPGNFGPRKSPMQQGGNPQGSMGQIDMSMFQNQSQNFGMQMPSMNMNTNMNQNQGQSQNYGMQMHQGQQMQQGMRGQNRQMGNYQVYTYQQAQPQQMQRSSQFMQQQQQRMPQMQMGNSQFDYGYSVNYNNQNAAYSNPYAFYQYQQYQQYPMMGMGN